MKAYINDALFIAGLTAVGVGTFFKYGTESTAIVIGGCIMVITIIVSNQQ